MDYYESYGKQLHDCLQKTVATSRDGGEISVAEAVTGWCARAAEVGQSGGTMYFVGNGASAMMASHMAADATKNARLRALAFNDAAFLTAISNDESFEQSFALPIRRFARAGDMLVAISSSGNSPNIIAAIGAAREQAMQVITLSGMSAENKSRRLGDVNFYVPAQTYGIVECCHHILLHCWLDQYMGIEEWDGSRRW